MNQLLLAAAAAALLTGQAAQAGPISFLNLQYEATAVATSSDGAPGVAAQSGVMGASLVSIGTDSLGARDAATAGAIVGAGFLSTSADVSASGISSATAVARLFGSFLNAGPVSLDIGYTPVSFSDGSGDAQSALYISLISDGITLFADFVTASWQFAYTPRLGSTSVLDVTLTSEVSAAFLASGPGNASSVGMVTILGTVPEPSTWALGALGLVVLAARRRGQGKGG